MALCPIPGEAPCGALGCLGSSRCCQPEIDFGCVSTAKCFTNSGTIGCLRSTFTMASGPRPCYGYTEAAALGTGCGTANWCFVCTDTASAYCHTDIVVGGPIPITAMSCDSTSGTKSFTINPTTGTPTAALFPSTVAITKALPTITQAPVIPSRVTITATPVPPTPAATNILSTPTTAPPGRLTTLEIAGIALGGVFCLAMIGLLAFFLLRKGKKTSDPIVYPPPIPVQSPGPPGYPPYGGQGPGGGTNYGMHGGAKMHEVSG